MGKMTEFKEEREDDRIQAICRKGLSDPILSAGPIHLQHSHAGLIERQKARDEGNPATRLKSLGPALEFDPGAWPTATRVECEYDEVLAEHTRAQERE